MSERHARRWWIGWGTAVSGTLLLVGLATLPPFAGPELRAVLMAAFSGACHQIAERSPHVGGVALAVCHRCYGIYWGLPLAAAAYAGLRRWDGPLGRAARLLVPLSLVPLGVDWVVDVLGWWANTPGSRFVTGGVFGLAAGLYLARGLAGLSAPRPSAARVTHDGRPVPARERRLKQEV